MAGTKYSAEAMGFVQFFFPALWTKRKKDKSVGERSAAGEA
jgi:hypothetical protein